MRRWIGRGLIVFAVLLVVALVFRQGLLPASWTPLPRLDLKQWPVPLFVDWQLAELRYDRRLCSELVADSGGILVARQIGDRPLEKGCGWTNAVRVTSAGEASIGVGRVTCQTAAALALWVKYDVQPLARQILGQPVVALENFGTYSCRNIVGNSMWQFRRSEHATANAIDISGFRLKDGTRISVLNDWEGKGKKSLFLQSVHYAACRYFRVSLSPDFNAAHRDHFHFDRGVLYTCR